MGLAAAAAGARVVFTQDTHRDGDPEFAIWPPHAIEGTHGHAIVDELHPLPDDTIIRKPRYDAFYGTPLDHLLRQWGVTTLVICGTVANICVHYTASSAALRWYDVVIPRDATSALDPFDLAASLRQTTSLLAGRVTGPLVAIVLRVAGVTMAARLRVVESSSEFTVPLGGRRGDRSAPTAGQDRDWRRRHERLPRRPLVCRLRTPSDGPDQRTIAS